jgi:Tol biopolymer transport system component
MVMKNKFSLLTLSLLIFFGCGQNNQSQGTGNKSGDVKVKSDSTQQNEKDSSALKLSDLPKFKLTFEREGGINIINSDLSGERFLFNGHDNVIYPDGSKVVTTKNNQDGSRTIAVYDVQNKTTKILSSVSGKQSFDANFSPDGKSIVFCNFSGKKWNIALVNLDDTGFKILSDRYKTDLFSPTFAADGNSILCQDMQNFIEFDLKGNIIKTISLKEITGDKAIYFSSGNKGYFIDNKESILFDADTEDFFDTSREPISNVFIYNVKNKTLKNLSDKNISTYDPFPLSDGKHILVSAYTKSDLSKSSDPADMEPVVTSWIYIMNSDGTGKTKLIKNAMEPSASRTE